MNSLVAGKLGQRTARWGGLCALVLAAAAISRSQSAAPQPHGTVERVKVHGASLERNLEGHPARR